MSTTPGISRRGFLLRGLAASSLCAVGESALVQGGERLAVRIASNQGVENATLQRLMLDCGLLGKLALDARLVPSRTVSGPLHLLLADEADICMVSSYVGVLPAIERGADVRLVGAAMLLPALAVYTRRQDLLRVEELAGRTVGVGPKEGLLRLLMTALLRKKGIDPCDVRFVDIGSNVEVFKAVADGRVDAGLSGIAGLAHLPQVRVLEGGRLWRELPEYTYQPAYASVRALRERAHALARCLAGYAMLFRYLSGPNSQERYLAARRQADGAAGAAAGKAIWQFIQKHHPYALGLGLAPRRVAYLQQLNVALGLQSRVLPFEKVADMSPARAAGRYLA